MAAFDAAKHDIGINGVGYLLADKVPVVRADAVPSTARAASGEGRYDSFQTESFYAQSEWGGGAGQARFVAPDQFVTGIGDGGWGGTFFPARKKITESDGGTASWFFERQGTLYGLTASAIETIGSATSAAITTGTPLCKPVVSAADNVLWVTNESGTKKIRRWDGTTQDDVSISNVTPSCVSRFGRSIQAYGQRTLASSLSLRGSAIKYENSTANTSHTLAITTLPKPNNTAVITVHLDANATTPTVTDWQAVPGSLSSSSVWMFYKKMGGSETSVRVVLASSSGCTIIYQEINGTYTLTDSSALDTSDSQSNAAATNCATPSITPSAAATILIAAGTKADGSTTNIGLSATVSAWSNSFTALSESSTNTTDHNGFAAYRIVSSSSSYTTTATTTSSIASCSMIAAFQKTTLSADITQTTMHYTLDDGATWNEFFQGDTAGIPKVTTALAAQGFLWLGTTRGVYQMSIEEHEFEDHQIKFLAGIRGPVDEWSVPFNTASVCTWMAAFDGLIYYNVGSTVRQFAPGGSGRQVWPSESWNTVSGEVQSIVSGEGGIYFGTAGYLWRYNGRGVMPLAAEPAADDFDFMQWHNGRLYFADDPASYFNFQYPSSRPDIALTSAANFTTGYMVSSRLDFEKTSESKVIRQFELQGYFTGGTTSTETGSIALHYIVADGLSDPGRLGGGATSLTWVSCGTALTSGDGGIKRYALATPLTAKAIYLRVTLTPGTVGYPVLTAVIANGRAIMPVVRRFTETIDISVGLKDRQQTVMYETKADAAAAIAALETLRSTGTYFNLDYVLSNSTSSQYVVTFDQKQDQLLGFRHDDQMSAAVSCNLLELP